MQRTAIILAGGKSSRMGKDKALLKIGNQTVIEKIIEEISKVTENILIVTNHISQYQFLNLPMLEDEWKEMGPLAGLHAGLSNSRTEENLIVACDMPFVSAEIGEVLLENLQGYDAAIPRIENQIQPLFAAYRKDVHVVIAESIKAQQLKMRSFLDKISVKIIEDENFESLKEIAFFNMNNPNDYKKALILMNKKE